MKYKTLLAALLLLVVLAGCSDKYTKVSDSNAVVMTIGSVEVKKSQLYGFLVANDGANSTLDAVMNHITEQNVERTAELEEEAKESLKNLKSALGDEFTSFIKGYGYDSEETYYEEVVLYNARNAKLIAKYIETKFDTLALTQKPRKVQVIEIADKDKAASALEKLNAGEAFSVVGKEFGSTSFYGKEEILTSSSSLDPAILTRIVNTTSPTFYKEVLEGEKGKFYLVNVVEGDPEKFKAEAIETLANNSSISDEATRHFLKEAGFKIYDKSIYNQLKQTAPDLIFD